MSTSSCVSDSSSGIQLSLCSLEMWKRFPAPMEMYVAGKIGRKVFPYLEYDVKGLDTSKLYEISLHMERVDNFKYSYTESGKWERRSNARSIPPVRSILHEDGIRTGEFWMNHPVSFEQIRITNDMDNKKKNHVFVQSLHMWRPVITVKEISDSPICAEFRLDVTQFMAVTVYKDEKIRELKCSIDRIPPFARPAKRQMSRDSDDSFSCSAKKRLTTSLTQHSYPTPPPSNSPPTTEISPTSSTTTQNEQLASTSAPMISGTQHVFPMNGAPYPASPHQNMWSYDWMPTTSFANYMEPIQERTSWMNPMGPETFDTNHMNAFGPMTQFCEVYPPMNQMGTLMEPPMHINHQMSHMGQIPPMTNFNTTSTGFWDPMICGYYQ